MMNEPLLAAVARLPEVGTPILRHCDGVRALHARADELEKTALALRRQADQLQDALLARVRKNWTPGELRAAGLEGHPCG